MVGMVMIGWMGCRRGSLGSDEYINLMNCLCSDVCFV